MIKVDEKICPQNHRCPAVKVCPVNTISQEGHALPKINSETCIKCLKCIRFCPLGAIKFI